MGKRTKHTHKYMRQQLSKFNTGWRCVLDYCEHYLPRNVEDTIEGRMSVCWGCSEDFKLDSYALKDDRPMCIDCRTPDEKKEIDDELDIRLKIAARDRVDAFSVTMAQIEQYRRIMGE